MDIYHRYPMMRPYVGSNFHRPDEPRLLLVGESHYLPEGSTQHASPERWYSGTSATLNDTERGWIHTSAIIEGSRQEKFKNRAHGIWKNAFKVINESGPRYSDFCSVADDIAFCNFFLRPGKKGKSLEVTEQDATIANDALAANCRTLSPTAVVFISALAHGWLRNPDSLGVPIVATPHPTSHAWNRPAKKYGGRPGREVLADFIKSLRWPTS